MKKTILITTGIFILIITLLVWVYLMMFGAPEDGGEIFANLGFQPGNQETVVTDQFIPTDSPTLENLVDTSSPEQLKQLTTRPVAGFASLTSSTTEIVRYVERGTGHIYEIDLISGIETQISRTTVARVSEATFSPSGETVAVTSYNGYKGNTFVGTITADATLNGIDLEPNATDISFIDNSIFRYTIARGGTSYGYEHNLTTESRTELFRFNYTNLHTLWGSEGDTPIIITKPAAELRSYVYEITGSAVTPILPSAYGLTGFKNDDWFILTLQNDGQPQFIAREQSTDRNYELPIVSIKEKCVFDSVVGDYLWCGAPVTAPATFVDDWSKGITRAEDFIWLVDLRAGSAELITDPERLLGYTLDIKNLSMDALGQNLFFLNKDDLTLWQFDLLEGE